MEADNMGLIPKFSNTKSLAILSQVMALKLSRRLHHNNNNHIHITLTIILISHRSNSRRRWQLIGFLRKQYLVILAS
jgi:hypothetical protein